MKKAVFLVVIVLHFGILNSATPKILWEREIEPFFTSELYPSRIFEHNNKFVLIYYFRLQQGTFANNAGVVILDKQGNIVNSFTIIRDY